MFYRHKIPVMVEGKQFDSIQAAGQYLGIKPVTLARALRCSKKRKCKGLTVAYANESRENKLFGPATPTIPVNKCKTSKVCPVECICANGMKIKFPSISAAARNAHADQWTMGLKMQTAGKFIDDKGNTYTRLIPMNTDKVYVNTGATLQKAVSNHTPRKKTKSVVETPVVETPAVKEQPKQSGIQLAQTILKGKAIDYIQQNKFDVAKELLDIVKKIEG